MNNRIGYSNCNILVDNTFFDKLKYATHIVFKKYLLEMF